MSYAQEVMDEVKKDSPAQETQETRQETQETSQEAPQETQEQHQETAEEKPAGEQVEEETGPQDAPEGPESEPAGDTPAEQPPKEKKDLSGLTKEQKAEFAFQKQLAKQKSKYESSLNEIKETFQKQIDEVKASLKKDEEPKHREDFDTDDEFIDYLVERKMEAKMAKDSEADRQKSEEDERKRKQMEDSADRFRDNCRASFADEKEYEAFSGRVRQGVQNGLGEILDMVPPVRDYLFYNPDGPKVLDRMLLDRNECEKVFALLGNPTDALVTLHEMAREIKAAPPAETEKKPAATMPHLGKPGTSQASSSRSIFDSDEDLIAFARSRRG